MFRKSLEGNILKYVMVLPRMRLLVIFNTIFFFAFSLIIKGEFQLEKLDRCTQ